MAAPLWIVVSVRGVPDVLLPFALSERYHPDNVSPSDEVELSGSFEELAWPTDHPSYGIVAATKRGAGACRRAINAASLAHALSDSSSVSWPVSFSSFSLSSGLYFERI